MTRREARSARSNFNAISWVRCELNSWETFSEVEPFSTIAIENIGTKEDIIDRRHTSYLIN